MRFSNTIWTPYDLVTLAAPDRERSAKFHRQLRRDIRNGYRRIRRAGIDRRDARVLITAAVYLGDTEQSTHLDPTAKQGRS